VSIDRGRWLLALALAAFLVSSGCWEAPGPPAGPDVEGEVSVSLLAVGDTGRRMEWAWMPSAQRRVGAAMAAADRQRPVDALLLLGDNFYPKGLEAAVLVPQVAMNVVRPYCRFVDLSAPRSAEVADACRRPAAERRPVPIFAVLGNHDYRVPESPKLQAEAVPDFVANWDLPEKRIAVRELGEGVSLVLLQSMETVRKAQLLEDLPAAIRSARGPWRILICHHPVAPTRSLEDHGRFEARYMEEARRRIAEAGVPLQLVLSGHHHSLQIIEPSPPGPPLQVVAGGGGGTLDAVDVVEGQRFSSSRHGFARVDLVRRAGSERLVVSLYATGSPWLPGGRPSLAARWSVALDGTPREEEAPR
jgi:predicted MPP superfamily phosphohydrolase